MASKEVETKTQEKKGGGHGKTQYYKSPEYIEKQKFRTEMRKLCKSAGSPAVDAQIKSICSKHGEPYVEGEIPEMFKGIITREKGWIKDVQGYKPCLWGNSWRDWGIHTSILILLYLFYTGFFLLTYMLYVWSGDTILWIYFGMMCVAMTVLMIVVGKGYMDLDHDMEEEIEKEKAGKTA